MFDCYDISFVHYSMKQKKMLMLLYLNEGVENWEPKQTRLSIFIKVFMYEVGWMDRFSL